MSKRAPGKDESGGRERVFRERKGHMQSPGEESVDVQKLLSLSRSHLFIFVLFPLFWEIDQKKILL